MKLVVRIFNIIYLALAAIACVTLFTSPFLQVNGTLSMSKDDVTLLLKDSLKEYMTETELKDALVFKDKDGNITEKLSVNVSISFPSSLVLDSKNTENTEKVIYEQLSPLVEDTVKDLNPSIKSIAKVIVEKQAKAPLKTALEDQIENYSSGFYGDDLAEKMEEWGIDDSYIEGFIGGVFEVIAEAGGTVDDVLEVVTEHITDVCNILKDNGVEGFEDFDETQIEDMSEEIKDELVTALQDAGLCDEDGNLVTLEDYIASLLEQGFGETEDEETTEEDGTKSIKSIKRGLTPEEKEAKQKEAEERLTNKIVEILSKKLTDLNLPNVVSKYGIIGAALLIFLVIPWLVFAIVTFVRTLRRKKIWTKTWTLFSMGWLTFVLGIVLTIGSNIALPKIIPILPEGAYKDVLSGMTITLKTSAFIPSIIFLCIIPIAIVYAVFVHKVKKQNKKI